ncbi:MAG: hypothetical protein IJT94_01855 [Oscillibacter sp.]|nr:hypothetical protein [Oscillibacter sp.]
MAEDKDLKQRVLEKAREHQIEDRIVESFLKLLDDDKIKPTDWPKIVEWFQPTSGQDAPSDTLLEDLNVEDMSQYTEEELRQIQAQLELILKGRLDGDEKEPPPGTEAPPTDRQRTDGRRPPSGTPKPESSGTPGINLELGDFLHG